MKYTLEDRIMYTVEREQALYNAYCDGILIPFYADDRQNLKHDPMQLMQWTQKQAAADVNLALGIKTNNKDRVA